MTAVKDPDIHRLEWDGYRALLDAGKLKERICVLWAAGITLAPAQQALDQVDRAPRFPASLGDSRLLSTRQASRWAEGIYGQALAINPEEKLVLVQWSTWAAADAPASLYDEQVLFFDGLVRALHARRLLP